MKDYTLEKRKYVIGMAAVVIVLIYVIRLFDLQIMTDDYKKNADSNAFLNKIQYPSRGAICNVSTTPYSPMSISCRTTLRR